MVIFHGTRLYGKVDQVPGLFHVATQFFYVQFVPFIPIGTYIVFDGTVRDDGTFKGQKLGLSFKSVLIAYIRVALFLAGCGLLVAASIMAFEILDKAGRLDWMPVIILVALSALMFFAFWGSYRLTHAGPTRALKLANKVGITPEEVAKYFAHRMKNEEVDSLAEKLQGSQAPQAEDY